MTKKKLKVTAVSYLNTKPLLFGLFKSTIADKIDLELDIPSVCASKLKNGQADLGLVPVAIIPELERPSIISNFCIGSTGSVRTVCIYGNCPITEMESIYLDHHSRTSVELARLLLRDYWQVSPRLIPASEGYEGAIDRRTGGLIIGDRAISRESQFQYRYDLGAAWTAHTGLPFVFAAWVATKELAPEFISEFNEGLQTGIDEIPQLMYLLSAPVANFSLEEYFTHYISYRLDAEKRKALSRFLNFLKPGVELQFDNQPEYPNVPIS